MTHLNLKHTKQMSPADDILQTSETSTLRFWESARI